MGSVQRVSRVEMESIKYSNCMKSEMYHLVEYMKNLVSKVIFVHFGSFSEEGNGNSRKDRQFHVNEIIRTHRKWSYALLPRYLKIAIQI